MTLLDLPAAVTSPDELLGTANNILDDETQALESSPAASVSCRPDCNACCNHAVMVTAAEARAIKAAVAQLGPDVKEQVVARAKRVLQRATDAGLAGPATGNYARRYYGLAEPCPLLVDGQCAVRSVRPLVCRAYLMSSPPEACNDPSLERAVKIRRSVPVATNFVRVSAQFGEDERTLLPSALLAPPPRRNEAPRSGPKLARLLLARPNQGG